MARIRSVAISIEVLQEIMTQGWTVGDGAVITCKEGLPEGARFVGSRYGLDEKAVILEFEHESFRDLGLTLSDPAPLIDVVFVQKVTFGPCVTTE